MTTATRTESPFDALERLAPLIRQYADEAERQSTLARPVADAMIEAGLFRRLAPASVPFDIGATTSVILPGSIASRSD